VIAKNCVDAERRAQPAKLGRPGRRWHVLGDKTMCREVVAKHNDKIAAERISGVHDLPNTAEAHVRPAGVQVGYHGNRETLPFWPVGWR
jgi:hypothetical protein